jgi:NAD-dependent deacetylase
MSTMDELVRRLRAAHRVVILTGAGISAESGIPTFREAQTGLWSRFSPEELATPEAFARNPKLVWEWYEWRRDLISKAQPNAGHLALVELERLLPEVTIVTQNVDGLHQRAGSNKVIEFHGNIFRDLCSKDSHVALRAPGDSVPPICSRCGAFIRPGVVWFGESIPGEALRRATACVDACDTLLSIGTSSLVYPAAALAERALTRDGFVAEINPATTPLNARAQISLRESAAVALPRLLEQLKRVDKPA